MTGRRERPAWWGLLPLAALWLAPVAVVAAALPLADAREEESVASRLPSTVVVGSRTTDHRTAVTAVVRLGPAAAVRTQAAGLLTALPAPTGRVRAGQRLFDVDGVPVLAFPADAPLFRPLRRGDRGDDVRALERFLVGRAGLPAAAVDEAFGARTTAAVRRLQDELGVAKDGVFRPSYVAYLPPAVDAVAIGDVAVGAPLAAGDVVLVGAPAALAVDFEPATEGRTLRALADAPLALRLGEQAVPLSGLSPRPAEAAAVHAALQAAAEDGRVERDEVEGQAHEQYSGAVLARASEERRGVVPATAVHLAASGAACVFVPAGDGYDAVELASVDAAVGELGAVPVDASLVGREVVREPASLPAQAHRRCS